MQCVLSAFIEHNFKMTFIFYFNHSSYYDVIYYLYILNNKEQ